MAVLRSALGDHQVIPAVLFVHVRPLGAASPRAAPDDLAPAEQTPCREVDLGQMDLARALRRQEIRLSVVVEEEVRVDAALAHIDRVGPFARRVLRRDVKIPAAGHVGRDHVERAVVVADRRRVDAIPHADVLQAGLRGTCDAVADLLPVDQVLAVMDRHAGEIAERAVHHVVIVAHAAHARIGVEARQDRVAVAMRLGLARSRILLSGDRGRNKDCRREQSGEREGSVECHSRNSR